MHSPWPHLTSSRQTPFDECFRLSFHLHFLLDLSTLPVRGSARIPRISMHLFPDSSIENPQLVLAMAGCPTLSDLLISLCLQAKEISISSRATAPVL